MSHSTVTSHPASQQCRTIVLWHGPSWGTAEKQRSTKSLLCCLMRLRHWDVDTGLPPGFAGLWRLAELHARRAHGLLQAHSPILMLGQVVTAARIHLRPAVESHCSPHPGSAPKHEAGTAILLMYRESWQTKSHTWQGNAWAMQDVCAAVRNAQERCCRRGPVLSSQKVPTRGPHTCSLRRRQAANSVAFLASSLRWPSSAALARALSRKARSFWGRYLISSALHMQTMNYRRR